VVIQPALFYLFSMLAQMLQIIKAMRFVVSLQMKQEYQFRKDAVKFRHRIAHQRKKPAFTREIVSLLSSMEFCLEVI
jgi:hypothetical protein